VITGNVIDSFRRALYFASGTPEHVTFKNNKLINPFNILNPLFSDAVGSVEDLSATLNERYVTFMAGGDSSGYQTSQFWFNGTNYEVGWEIDAANEWTSTGVSLPDDCIQLVRIVIYAVVNNTDPDGMNINVTMHAGFDNEQYDTHSVSARTTSITGGFIVNDIIIWIFDWVEAGNQFSLMSRGDMLTIFVEYSNADATNIATDAVFIGARIDYL